MDAVGIVETFNKKIEGFRHNKDIYFVLHKKIECMAIKAYKQYDYTLWYINKDKKYQAIRIVHSARAVTDKEKEDIVKYMECRLLDSILGILLTPDVFDLMLEGKFTGYGI